MWNKQLNVFREIENNSIYDFKRKSKVVSHLEKEDPSDSYSNRICWYISSDLKVLEGSLKSYNDRNIADIKIIDESRSYGKWSWEYYEVHLDFLFISKEDAIISLKRFIRIESFKLKDKISNLKGNLKDIKSTRIYYNFEDSGLSMKIEPSPFKDNKEDHLNDTLILLLKQKYCEEIKKKEEKLALYEKVLNYKEE